MFANTLQVMLYVNDVLKAKGFWEELGFSVLSQEEMDGTIIVELTPNQGAEIRFVLYDRAFIEQHSPEVATNSPSIMFESEQIEELYKKILTMDVAVGDLIQLETTLVFNFADPDGNYFAVTSK